MDGKLTLIDVNGREVKCDIVALFTLDNKGYVAYIDDELDLLVSRFTKQGEDTIVLEKIEDDEEWEKVEEYLDKNVFDEDDHEEI